MTFIQYYSLEYLAMNFLADMGAILLYHRATNIRWLPDDVHVGCCAGVGGVLEQESWNRPEDGGHRRTPLQMSARFVREPAGRAARVTSVTL